MRNRRRKGRRTMQMTAETLKNQVTITINAKEGLDKLRKLVDELEDGVILSIDLSEVIDDGQEDGES